jgi:hypothetical protein
MTMNERGIRLSGHQEVEIRIQDIREIATTGLTRLRP